MEEGGRGQLAGARRDIRHGSADRRLHRNLGRLNLPIVFDLEIGLVPPHLPLINGVLATITIDGKTRQITQELR